MKKAPKGIKRKGYQYGNEITKLDANGNPIITKEEKTARALGDKTGDVLGGIGGSYYATKQNENDADAIRSGGMGAVSKMGGIGGAIGGIAAIGDQIGAPIKKKSEQVDMYGNVKDENKAKQNAIGGALFSPSKALAYRAKSGDWTSIKADKYLESIEQPYKEQIAKEKMAATADQIEMAKAARNRGETSFTSVNEYRPHEFAKGGEIKGKGTGTSDSINAEVEEGSFVVPEKHAHVGKMIKNALLKKKTGKADLHQKGENTVPVKLSNGEILFTPEEKDEIEKEMGEEMLEALAPEAEENEEGKAKGGEVSESKAREIMKDGTIRGKALTDKQKRYFGWIIGGRKMATGGNVDGNPNKVDSKTPPVKKASDLEKLKQDNNFELGDKKSSQKKTGKTGKSKAFVPREYIDPIKPNLAGTETQDALKEISNPNSNAVDTNPVTTHTSNKSNFWDKVNRINTEGLGSAIANYGLAAYQIQKGKEGLKDKRPVNTIDPTFLENVNTAQKNAKFGFTPEQQFLLDQQNQNLLNADRFAARNYSGGSGGNAYNMERNASNNAFMRSLQNASANTELQQGKQQFAAQLAAQKANMSRTIFEDALGAFQQKQAAAGAAVNAGISNIFDANRFANFLKLREKEQNFNNQYNP